MNQDDKPTYVLTGNHTIMTSEVCWVRESSWSSSKMWCMELTSTRMSCNKNWRASHSVEGTSEGNLEATRSILLLRCVIGHHDCDFIAMFSCKYQRLPYNDAMKWINSYIRYSWTLQGVQRALVCSIIRVKWVAGRERLRFVYQHLEHECMIQGKMHGTRRTLTPGHFNGSENYSNIPALIPFQTSVQYPHLSTGLGHQVRSFQLFETLEVYLPQRPSFIPCK